MRIIYILICLLLTSNVSQAENVRENDAIIYKSVLKAILDHEKPEHFAVWNQTLDREIILTPRVPQHAPENQFVSSLHGLPAVLQKQLLSAESSALPVFDPAVSFTDRSSLLRTAPGVIAVGLSKIVYDQRHNALVYSEDCLIAKDHATCGGDSYWFVQSGGTWKLKKHASVWEGESIPFWSIGQP